MAVIAVTTAWLLAQDPRRYGVSHEHRRTAQAREAAGRTRDALSAAKRAQHRAALQQLLADGPVRLSVACDRLGWAGKGASSRLRAVGAVLEIRREGRPKRPRAYLVAVP